MSHFATIKLGLTGSPDDMKCALVRMGFKADMIETHNVRSDIFDISGKTQGKGAHLIVRARHVGSASNDIGFERMADGSWDAHISDFDRGVRKDAQGNVIGQVGRYGTIWQNRLKGYNALGKIYGWAGASKWTERQEVKEGKTYVYVEVTR